MVNMVQGTDTSLSAGKNIRDLFRGVFSTKQGLVIGETHDARAQYKILIDNMEFLANECKVGHIATEAFLMEEADLLAEYFNKNAPPEVFPLELLKTVLRFDVLYRQGLMFSDKFTSPDFSKDFDKYMENYFIGIEDGFVVTKWNASAVFKEQKEVFDGLILNEYQQPYNLLHLLIEAKRNNIHLIGIDNRELRDDPNITNSFQKRMELLPTAAKQVLQEVKGNYLVHTGAGHSFIAKNVDRKAGNHVYGMSAELGIPAFNIIESYKLEEPMEIRQDGYSMYVHDSNEPYWDELYAHVTILVNPEKLPLEVGEHHIHHISPTSREQISTINLKRQKSQKLYHGITPEEQEVRLLELQLDRISKESFRFDMLMSRIAETYVDYKEGKVLPLSKEALEFDQMKKQAVAIARESLNITEGSDEEKLLFQAMKKPFNEHVAKEEKQRSLDRLV